MLQSTHTHTYWIFFINNFFLPYFLFLCRFFPYVADFFNLSKNIFDILLRAIFLLLFFWRKKDVSTNGLAFCKYKLFHVERKSLWKPSQNNKLNAKETTTQNTHSHTIDWWLESRRMEQNGITHTHPHTYNSTNIHSFIHSIPQPN